MEVKNPANPEPEKQGPGMAQTFSTARNRRRGAAVRHSTARCCDNACHAAAAAAAAVEGRDGEATVPV